MTPAERLLAAADLLEKRAGEATDGPWILAKHKDGRTLGIDARDGYDEVIQGGDVRCMAYCLGGTSTVEAEDADWRYIATMHPEVGKALGEWLRELSGDVSFFGVTEQNAYNVRHGLALADLLLAGTS